jgi:hypothetical protein
MWLLLIRKLTSLPMGNIEPPTAVFVGSGNLAIGVLRVEFVIREVTKTLNLQCTSENITFITSGGGIHENPI